MKLLVPGPTPYPKEVLCALSREAIYHRAKEFEEIMERVTLRLKQALATESDVLLLTCSGTGGMEAAVANTLSPNDKVAVFSCGYFGNRFAEIALAYGAKVFSYNTEWGQAVHPEYVEACLAKEPDIKAVFVTHNETSTAITNPLQEIASSIRKYDKLLIVDAISSAGAIPLYTDEWGLDIVITASQKAFMAPPGIAMISVSRRAWQAHKNARMPHFYFDFKKAKNALLKNQTPWSPAIAVICALDASLSLIASEGIENVFIRHQKLAEYTRKRLRNLGLELYGDQRFASDVVTAIFPPEGIPAKQIIRQLKENYGMIIAGGWGKLDDKIFRIAHMGRTEREDIDTAIDALCEITGGARL